MSSYIRQLNQDLEQQRRREADRERQDADAARERLVSLDERLKRLLASIPVEVQAAGLSLSSLQTSLRGRRRGTCHVGELGAALRRAGFVRRRQWSGSQDFRALWVPRPTNEGAYE